MLSGGFTQNLVDVPTEIELTL